MISNILFCRVQKSLQRFIFLVSVLFQQKILFNIVIVFWKTPWIIVHEKYYDGIGTNCPTFIFYKKEKVHSQLNVCNSLIDRFISSLLLFIGPVDFSLASLYHLESHYKPKKLNNRYDGNSSSNKIRMKKTVFLV